ncbi:MAG: FGGY-family carbohydrate kinase [Actinocatenispora sp.]
MTGLAEQVLGIDVGGSAVKVWDAGPEGVRTRSAALPVLRPGPHRVEFDPEDWWRRIAAELRAHVADAPPGRYAGLVVSSMRQAFVLVGDDGEIGAGVLNSDRRGAGALDRLREVPAVYEVTRHWLAPELTLPKLLAIAAREPDRWARTRRMLFVHDWLVWRLTGEQVTEVSYACAGQLADVARRGWATDLLTGLGLDTARLAPLVEPGTPVGTVRADDLGVPVGLPVHAGCGDTQLAAAGAGGLRDGVVTVVAGSSTPVQAATREPALDAGQRPWVSTHARADLWAAETNAGYPGMMAGWLRGVVGEVRRSGRPGAGGLTAVTATPHWTEHHWAVKAPVTMLGLSPAITPGDLAQAMDEAHAYAVRANITDLHEALGRGSTEVVVTGGGARSLAPLLADVLGRPVDVCPDADGTATAGRALVSGEPPAVPALRPVAPSLGPEPYQTAYQRYLDAHDALRTHLPEEDQ